VRLFSASMTVWVRAALAVALIAAAA